MQSINWYLVLKLFSKSVQRKPKLYSKLQTISDLAHFLELQTCFELLRFRNTIWKINWLSTLFAERFFSNFVLLFPPACLPLPPPDWSHLLVTLLWLVQNGARCGARNGLISQNCRVMKWCCTGLKSGNAVIAGHCSPLGFLISFSVASKYFPGQISDKLQWLESLKHYRPIWSWSGVIGVLLYNNNQETTSWVNWCQNRGDSSLLFLGCCCIVVLL